MFSAVTRIIEKHWLRLAGIVLAVSALLHIVSLSQPRQVVFDEVHFGKFVTAYCCTHERFFDIHPPHAKLLIAGAAKLGGYLGDFSFENISQSYTTQPVWALRIVPALAGTILPLIVLVLLQQLGASRAVSLLGAAAVLFDNALTLQTRVIALDGVLLVATFGSLVAYLAAERRERLASWGYFVLAGALAGLAAGTKFTGLAAVALLGILTAVHLYQGMRNRRSLLWALRGGVVLASAILVYLLGWAVHYSLLTLPGAGDAWYVPTGNFLQDTKVWHVKMFDANYNLQATHPDASPWWTWPVMGQSVFYWQRTDASGQAAFLYFLGNPVVWWGSGVLFVAGLIGGAVHFGRRAHERTHLRFWIPLVGYVIAMLPLVRVPRALFLYHYLTPLLFSLIFGLLWLESTLGSQPSRQGRVVLGAVVLLLLGFIWFAPFTYGILLSQYWQPLLFWFPGWR